MNQWNVRKVMRTDAAEIASIYNHYVLHTSITFETERVGEKEMENRIQAISNDYPYIICIENDAVVGYAYAHLWKEKAAYSRTWETTVYVHPDYLGKGIGEMLMRKLIEDCQESGAHVLIACITADNQGSIEFHRRLGFKTVSHFSEVGFKFNKWHDIIDMTLTL